MAGSPWPLRPGELGSVRALVDGVNTSGNELSPSDYLSVGQDVVVTAGPFKGMWGVLQQIRGRARVIVKLSAIRQAIGVEMERGLVEPVDRDKPDLPKLAVRPSSLSGSYV